MFELGLSIGSSIPIAILAEPSARIPFDIASIRFARVSLSRADQVEGAIRSLLKTIETGRSMLQERPHDQVKRINAGEARKRLRSLRQNVNERRLADFVQSLFEQAGIAVSVIHGPNEVGADMAIWLDGVDLILGNPILIEIKNKLSQRDLAIVHVQVRQAMTALGAQCALIICNEDKTKGIRPMPPWPLLVVLTVDELIEVLSKGHLSNALVESRNRAVHGSL